MSSLASIVPKTPETAAVFRLMLQAPNDEKPIVEMNDETARNMDVIWSSIEDVATRWRGGKDSCFPGMPMDRKEFWGAFAQDHNARPLPVVEEFIGSSLGKGKTAIDLGCGNSPTAKPLLQRGWRVIAVDNSISSLNVLAAQNKAEVASGQLSIINEDVTTFVPSEPADLVVAADIFPYIDPTKFRATWTKVHDTFIKERGFLIGTLFRSATQPKDVPVMNMMKEMGAWFLPDRRMVRPLLTQAGYEIKTCKYRIDDPDIDPICIQFIAEKKNTAQALS